MHHPLSHLRDDAFSRSGEIPTKVGFSHQILPLGRIFRLQLDFFTAGPQVPCARADKGCDGRLALVAGENPRQRSGEPASMPSGGVMQYNVDYFINKFEAIPHRLWTIEKYQRGDGTCCALGHCGEDDTNFATDGTPLPGWTKEGRALSRLFGQAGWDIAMVNDRADDRFPQNNPRDRVLAALHRMKELGHV